jgi:hypothetical protein
MEAWQDLHGGKPDGTSLGPPEIVRSVHLGPNCCLTCAGICLGNCGPGPVVWADALFSAHSVCSGAMSLSLISRG